MKRTLCFLLVALLYILQVSAQDTLVYRNGKREVARVLEVGEFTIRYNLLGTSNEPDRAVSRLDLQSIHFQNGKIEQFERPSRSDDPLLVRRLRIEEELGDSNGHFLVKSAVRASFRSMAITGFIKMPWPHWRSIFGSGPGFIRIKTRNSRSRSQLRWLPAACTNSKWDGASPPRFRRKGRRN